MTTTVESPEATPARRHQAERPIPFGRIVGVEIRKMFDTRAGLWLMIVTGGLIALAMGVTLLVLALNDNATITAQGFAEIMTIPLSLLLPVFAIVSVTGEWGQRSHLVTFTLEPNRAKIFLAKFVAVLSLALITLAVAIALGVLGNLASGAITGHEVVWNVDTSQLLWAIGLQLAYFAMAFAFGMLFLSTAGSIAVFYVVALLLPFMVYPPLMFMFEWAQNVIPWLDFNIAAAPLMTGIDFVGEPVDVSAVNYAQFISSLTLLVLIPLIIGSFRVLRSEVK